MTKCRIWHSILLYCSVYKRVQRWAGKTSACCSWWNGEATLPPLGQMWIAHKQQGWGPVLLVNTVSCVLYMDWVFWCKYIGIYLYMLHVFIFSTSMCIVIYTWIADISVHVYSPNQRNNRYSDWDRGNGIQESALMMRHNSIETKSCSKVWPWHMHI